MLSLKAVCYRQLSVFVCLLDNNFLLVEVWSSNKYDYIKHAKARLEWKVKMSLIK